MISRSIVHVTFCLETRRICGKKKAAMIESQYYYKFSVSVLPGDNSSFQKGRVQMHLRPASHRFGMRISVQRQGVFAHKKKRVDTRLPD